MVWSGEEVRAGKGAKCAGECVCVIHQDHLLVTQLRVCVNYDLLHVDMDVSVLLRLCGCVVGKLWDWGE